MGTELTNANIWSEWFPEAELRALLAGELVAAVYSDAKPVAKVA